MPVELVEEKLKSLGRRYSIVAKTEDMAKDYFNSAKFSPE